MWPVAFILTIVVSIGRSLVLPSLEVSVFVPGRSSDSGIDGKQPRSQTVGRGRRSIFATFDLVVSFCGRTHSAPIVKFQRLLLLLLLLPLETIVLLQIFLLFFEVLVKSSQIVVLVL